MWRSVFCQKKAGTRVGGRTPRSRGAIFYVTLSTRSLASKRQLREAQSFANANCFKDQRFQLRQLTVCSALIKMWRDFRIATRIRLGGQKFARSTLEFSEMFARYTLEILLARISSENPVGLLFLKRLTNPIPRHKLSSTHNVSNPTNSIKSYNVVTQSNLQVSYIPYAKNKESRNFIHKSLFKDFGINSKR